MFLNLGHGGLVVRFGIAAKRFAANCRKKFFQPAEYHFPSLRPRNNRHGQICIRRIFRAEKRMCTFNNSSWSRPFPSAAGGLSFTEVISDKIVFCRQTGHNLCSTSPITFAGTHKKTSSTSASVLQFPAFPEADPAPYIPYRHLLRAPAAFLPILPRTDNYRFWPFRVSPPFSVFSISCPS